MIYIILYSMGNIQDLFHFATLNRNEAEKMYAELMVTEYYPEKSLWSIDSHGIRTLITKGVYGEAQNAE